MTTKAFGPFAPAEVTLAYLKMALQGFGGSGKTFTAGRIAIGLWNHIYANVPADKRKPVAFLDTEGGCSFMVPNFKAAGVPLFSAQTKSFVELMDAMLAAEQNASILIVDSISVFWAEMQKAYKRGKIATNIKRREPNISEAELQKRLDTGKFDVRLTFQDWVPLKAEWGRFTEIYLNSKLHIIMCGRAKWEYDFVEDEESGNKQIEKTGSAMKAESELSFEPSLLVEMRHEDKPALDRRVDARFWDHVAYVLKDRSQKIDGKRFVNPDFKDFLPHIDHLNIGGKHGQITGSPKDAALFTRGGVSIAQINEQKTILCEEIKGEIVSLIPGRSEQDQILKAELMKKIFKTYSWVKIEGMDLPTLKDGLEKVRAEVARVKARNLTAKGGK